MRLGRERRYLVLLGLICLALIGGALYMQVALGEAPCPLCILQRYALLLIAIFAFIGAAMRTRRSLTIFEGLVVLSALAGAGVAGHHVYTQFFPRSVAASTCCNRLSMICRWRRSFRWGSRSMVLLHPYPPILGLSLAQWALVAFVLTVVLVPLLVSRNRKQTR